MERSELVRLLGQRLSVGFEGYEVPPEFRQLVHEYKIGNVILFRRNVRDREQLTRLCVELRHIISVETGYQPFIMLDEESGSVSRLSHIACPTPSAMAIGTTGDPENARAIGRLIGEELRSVGVNFNLAPVLDVMTNPLNQLIGIRSFGTTPEKAAEMGVAYMEGLQSTGVFACGKHFPGHGDTSVDSHIGLPVIERDQERIRAVELVPFRAAIDRGIRGIMSAHVIFPAFEPERKPATVSRNVMTGLLREELGFRGIILSDGMEMQAIMDLYGIENGVFRALSAGVDICLVCHSPRQAHDAMEYCLSACADGLMDEDELLTHYGRILLSKRDLSPDFPRLDTDTFGSEAQRALARRVMDQAVQPLHLPDGSLPLPSADALFIGAPARAQSLASDAVVLNAGKRLAEAVGAPFIEDFRPEKPRLLAHAARGGTVVSVMTNNDAALEERIALTNELAEAGGQVLAIAMTTPFLLSRVSDRCAKVAVYQYDAFGLESLARLLSVKL